MADGKPVTKFWGGRTGNLGISSLVLVALEKIMDNDFVCPCQPGYNEWICACYAVVPSILSFVFIWCFVASKPEDKVTKGKSTCDRFLFSALIAFIWLFLFFADGCYVSCACSHWDGEYTETGSLKWCKPTGNGTVVFESQQKTERCIIISQVSSELHTQQRWYVFLFLIKTCIKKFSWFFTCIFYFTCVYTHTHIS